MRSIMFLTENKYSLHRFWWLYLPPLVLVLVALVNPFLDKDSSPWMYSENGVLETLQWLVAMAAFGVGVACLRYCKGRGRWFTVWILLGTLGSLYIGLEEISYGQHLLRWETPEYWQNINDQGETNLHNTSSWFDQKPRLILLIGVIAGGIILPFVRRFRPAVLPARFNAIYPPDALFWTALCAALAHKANWLKKLGLSDIYNRPSEVNEIFLYYFVFLYLLLMLQRLRHEKSAG
ncbi:MAG: hypothetical protein ACK4PK_01300 [Alphaproteobacteria bacterium]